MIWAVVAILLVEVLGLSLRFDTTLILKSRYQATATNTGAAGLAAASWTVWFLSNMRLILRVSLVAAMATAIFAGRKLRDDLTQVSDAISVRWSWNFFAGHLLALALLFKVSEVIFDSRAAAGNWGSAWLASWLASGIVVVGSLIGSVIAPRSRTVLLLLRCVGRATGVGMAVGLVAALAGFSSTLLWKPLGIGTLELTHAALRFLGISTIYRPADFVIGTESFAVMIAPECSGYEGMGLVLTFLAAYLWFFRDRFQLRRAWILLPVGVLAIWLANTIRIVGLILVGTWISDKVALGGFHSQAGWIAFIAVTLGLVAVLSKCQYFLKVGHSTIEAEMNSAVSREAVYLGPLLAIVLTAIVTGAFQAEGLNYLYPLRLLAVAIPLWYYRREYSAMRWNFSWQAIALGAMVFAIWIARLQIKSSNAEVESTADTSGFLMALWIGARIVGSSITVPVAEELAFRGFLTRRLISADFDAIRPGTFTWISFLASSIVFGLLHDRWIEGTLAGMLYAVAYYRRGSIGDAAVAHATTNAMLSVEALMTGDWSLWS